MSRTTPIGRSYLACWVWDHYPDRVQRHNTVGGQKRARKIYRIWHSQRRRYSPLH
jgi:hypothetical protein